MAKKIVWTQTSIRDRFKIYEFWLNKNKSDLYSEKLEKLFTEAAKLLAEFPEIGTQTDFNDVRVKVIRDYKMLYINLKDSIQIIRVWGTRQNPDDLEFE
jgi:plasmid stabilization system protein ParE